MAEEREVIMLRSILESIVDDISAIKVKRSVDEMGVLLSFEVAKPERGMIIGKGGETIRAIRLLVKLAGFRSHARVNLKMDEPEIKNTEEMLSTNLNL